MSLRRSLWSNNVTIRGMFVQNNIALSNWVEYFVLFLLQNLSLCRMCGSYTHLPYTPTTRHYQRLSMHWCPLRLCFSLCIGTSCAIVNCYSCFFYWITSFSFVWECGGICWCGFSLFLKLESHLCSKCFSWDKMDKMLRTHPWILFFFWTIMRRGKLRFLFFRQKHWKGTENIDQNELWYCAQNCFRCERKSQTTIILKNVVTERVYDRTSEYATT